MSTEIDTDERAKWSPWSLAAAVLLAMLFGVIAFGTLRGCFFVDPQEAARREEERKKKKREEKEKKEEFEIKFPIVQPTEQEAGLQYAKPGHWATASQKMRANFRDFVGDSRLTLMNGQKIPYPIDNTPFVLRASRPILLTKGRMKATESTFFVPQTNQPIHLSVQLEERGLGLTSSQLVTQLSAMPSYQYHFVVLAKEPSRYSFIKTLDSVTVPFGGETEFDDIENVLHYRVEALDVSESIPLSDNPLTWGSIAYIAWDEVDPQLFTPEQERALVDWIHWGGQLIISGPDSLDLLKGSFLDAYLPAESGGPRKIDTDDASLVELNKGWMISTQTTPGQPLTLKAPWSAISLNMRPEARELPNTGKLIVERQVGRGRVVVTAMQLAERDLINWRSGFESLFNAALLRRPSREYRPGSIGAVTLTWADEKLRPRRLDARLTTNLRFLSRDLGVDTAYKFQEVQDESGQFQLNQFGRPEVMREYRAPNAAGGIGAWNDFSATASAAREALRKAAGVEVPGAPFVVLCLAIYLVALVPLNWLIFHTLGRVEWAWIAAPIIAVVGTFVVVNQAQLDIGFVRAQTEIGLLEQQPDHPRAHLSRFTAMYTSLSTTYELEYGNLTSLAAPFAASTDFQMLRGQSLQNVDFQRYDKVRLAGLPISSNSTGMVHSEQMTALDGAVRLGKSTASGGNQIENRSKLALNSVCVVRRPLPTEKRLAGVKLQGMWIGQMPPGQSASLALQSLDVKKPAFVAERESEAQVQSGDRLDLEPMFRLALDPKHLEEGETRLVARIDEVMPGQKITPVASQVRGATLVVVHLAYAPLAPPGKDRNTRQDFKNLTTDEVPEIEL